MLRPLRGKSPPTLTDYIDLSIGGTLSVGGIGGQVFAHGLQVDNVLELQVVTGKGKLVTCSPTHRKKLFNSVRAGLGQFGIIVRARVRLVDVPSTVRVYTAFYTEFADNAQHLSPAPATQTQLSSSVHRLVHIH